MEGEEEEGSRETHEIAGLGGELPPRVGPNWIQECAPNRRYWGGLASKKVVQSGSNETHKIAHQNASLGGERLPKSGPKWSNETHHIAGPVGPTKSRILGVIYLQK